MKDKVFIDSRLPQWKGNVHMHTIRSDGKLTPPELAKDVVRSGIYLTGGSSKMKNMDKLVSDITGLQVNVCENPDESVARGLASIIANPDYHKLAYTIKQRTLK